MSVDKWDVDKISESVKEFRKAYINLKRENESQEKVIKAQTAHINKISVNLQKFKLIVKEKKDELTKIFQRKENDLEEHNNFLTHAVDDLHQENHDYIIKIQELEQRVINNEIQISELEKELEIAKAQIAIQQDSHEDEIKSLKEKHGNECDRLENEIARLNDLLKNKEHNTENSYPWKYTAKNLRKGKKKVDTTRFPDLSDFLNTSRKSTKLPKKRKLFVNNPEEITDFSPSEKCE